MSRLKSAVGEAGTNSQPDVKYVQYLLNDWRLSNDGKPIAIDGFVGPLTTGAIREFQRAPAGVVDGRIDPNGAAIRRLEYCHISRIASTITPLNYLGTLSMTRPPIGGPTVETQANRYLDGLRTWFG